MRWAATTTLVLTFTAFHGANAQQPQPTRADFSPLEFLVGSCWVGTFPDGTKTDEHCFEWVFDRKFIRDRHVVRGGAPYEGETIYGWDAVTKRLTYWYWSSDGLVITGHVETTPEGVVFPSRYQTAKGDVELKAVWTRVGDNAYRVANSQRTETGWKPLWSMELTRKQ